MSVKERFHTKNGESSYSHEKLWNENLFASLPNKGVISLKYASKKQIWLCVSVLLVGTILSTFTAVLVLRNLGGLVGMFVEADADAAFDFVRIFEQTKDGQIAPHWLFPLLLFGAYAFALWRFSPRAKRFALHIILWTILFVLLLTVGFACSLMLTRVNDIRFCDLLAALLPVIGKL